MAASLNNLSMRALQQRLAELTKCATCGKSTQVANVGGYRQAFRGERVTLESHCACPGGPAEHLARQLTQQLELQAVDADAGMTADTIVDFEGESVRWGSLTLQDRKAYLAGGYPF